MTFATASNLGSSALDYGSSFTDILQGRWMESDAADSFRGALAELESEYAIGTTEAIDTGVCLPNQLARIYARQFISSLPDAHQPSDVYFDDEGEAVMEWHPIVGRAGVVHINGLGRLRFAFVWPGAVNYGEEPWGGMGTVAITDHLRRLLR